MVDAGNGFLFCVVMCAMMMFPGGAGCGEGCDGGADVSGLSGALGRGEAVANGILSVLGGLGGSAEAGSGLGSGSGSGSGYWGGGGGVFGGRLECPRCGGAFAAFEEGGRWCLGCEEPDCLQFFCGSEEEARVSYDALMSSGLRGVYLRFKEYDFLCEGCAKAARCEGFCRCLSVCDLYERKGEGF